MKLTFSILLFGLARFAYSQDTIPISSAELQQKSLDKNLQMLVAQKEVALAEAELLASRAMYLPNVTVSYTFINTNSPLNAFGLKLNQAKIGMMDFNPPILNKPSDISDYGAKIEVQQPLFNLDAVYQKKAGTVKSEVYKIKAERTAEYLQFELNKAYMLLQLAYKMVQTLREARQTTLANKQLIENYFKNGLVQKSDVLYINVRVEEIDNQIHFAQSNIQNASDYLFLLLNEDSANKIIKPKEELTYQKIVIDLKPVLNQNRKDLRAYQKSLDAYTWMQKSSASKFIPRLNAFGSYEFHDNKFAEFDAKGYLVGLQLSWNLFDGLKSKSEKATYKANYDKSKTELAQYIQQSELELKKVQRQLIGSELKVSFTQSALKQSREAYRIRKNRFGQGLEKSADLLVSETLMAQKELEYQQALFEYNVAAQYYQFLK